MRLFLSIVLFLVVVTVSIMGVRGSRSDKPPLEVFPDMDRQPRLKPQAGSGFFLDGRGDRPSVSGTVPLGSFHEDAYYATGKIDGAYGSGFPMVVTQELLNLGREKYAIFCAVCHGETGDGNGITKKHGMTLTPSYHDEVRRNLSEGDIYNTINKGKNNMGSYGHKLRIEERWAIVAYLRVLQRARNASIEDVAAHARGDLGL